MKCSRCQADNEVGARFCEDCGGRLEVACPSCGQAVTPGKPFCRACGAALASVPGAIAAARAASPASYTPEHLAEKILASKSALIGERKRVTVLFADMKGSMELLADRDPEEARALLDAVLERMMEAVHRYDGTVNQVMGDGIMALFGAPLALEDHAVRACYTALWMQDAVKRYATELGSKLTVPLQIRVGLNSGDVVVRSIRSDLRMDYTAVGQTTHLASRMERITAPGTILVTETVVRLASEQFSFKPLGLTPVKGLTDLVDVYELVAAEPSPPGLQLARTRGLAPFVGRQIEMSLLRAALDFAAAGRGQVVAVTGEPGIGKSRLLYEFVHAQPARGWLTLEGSCPSYGGRDPYRPIRGLLAKYLRFEDTDDNSSRHEKVTRQLLMLDESLRTAIPAVLALLDVDSGDSRWLPLDPLQRRQRIQDAVCRVLLRETQRQPLLLILENLHWVDSETQALLDSFVDSLAAARALLLVNYRPEYRHGWGSKTYYMQVRLDPLRREQAEEVLEPILGGNAALGPLKRQLIEVSGGNPFFLEESVRMLVETGVLIGERGAYDVGRPLPEVEVPPTVETILAARIDRLPADEKELLQLAAVIGKEVPLPLLAGIADCPEKELRPVLARLQAAEFLYETALFPEFIYTFKHALTHAVAYRQLLKARQRCLHAKVLEVMEGLYPADRLRRQAERLAHHAEQAERWDKAVDYLRASGERAYRRGALSEAVACYERGLELAARLPATDEHLCRAIDLRLDLHAPLLVIGEISRLVRLQLEAEGWARQIQDRRRLGHVLARMSEYAWIAAQYGDGIEYAERCLMIAREADDQELQVLANYVQGLNRYGRGEYREVIALLTPIVQGPLADLAGRLPGVSIPLHVAGRIWLAWALVTTGELNRAAHHAQIAIETAEELDHPQARASAYDLRAGHLLIAGEFAEALGWAERSVRLCEEHGLIAWLPAAYSTFGWVLAWSGRSAEGLAHLERAVAMYAGMGIKTHCSLWSVRWAEGLWLASALDGALLRAREALESARATGERGMEVLALQLLGQILADMNPADTESARATFGLAMAQAEELGLRPTSAHCHFWIGKLYQRSGQRAQAQVHLMKAAIMYDEMGMRFWLGKAQTTLRDLA